MEDKITIYTDGACSGNPGKGGWGAVLIYKDNVKEISGGEMLTTNNKMELTAVIQALKLIKKNIDIVIFTDSQYVKNGITVWMENWEKNNWKNSKKEEVKNKELWLELKDLSSKFNIEWKWVKGHANNEYNNKADFLATSAIKNLK